ncbi:MAG TPA: hypothetical protein VHW71_01840 [Steroidobacteraceae bacterium]|jgi:hypothetical protein|nr:hypothetical protein [Steroidobacteraceae bacterium]
MGNRQREAALNRARVQRHRDKLRTPESIIEDDTMEILRRNGYAVDTAGRIETCRGGRPVPNSLVPTPRWTHTHIAVVRIGISESPQCGALVAAVVAAVDEPGCLVGTGKDGAVLVFRISGDSYAFEPRYGYAPAQTEYEFMLDAKPGLFTTVGGPLDVAAYTWLNERSPANTPLMLLPPIHTDISQSALYTLSTFVRANGGRFGAEQPETLVERVTRERAERRAAGILVDEPKETDEEAQARADDALVAANPDLRPTDGSHALAVDAARKRIEGRKAAMRAEKEQKKAAASKAKMKEIQAQLGNVT